MKFAPILFSVLLTALTSLVFSQATGDIPLSDLELDQTPRFILKNTEELKLPAMVDLSGEMPVVGDQGNLPACAAWATAYYLRSYYQNTQNSKIYIEPFSPAYIYKLYTNRINKGLCKGFTTVYLLDSILINGVVPYSSAPYNLPGMIENCNKTPQPENALSNEALSHSMATYKTKVVRYIDEFKYLLSQGVPIVASIKVDDTFKSLSLPNPIQSKFNQQHYTKHKENHAVVIVGYDDAKKAFKLINSWGKVWGDKGFGWINYDLFYSVINYGCYIADYGELSDGLANKMKPESSKIKTAQQNNNTFESWFKEGYYRDYEDFNTRVVLKELNKKEQTARIELRKIDTDETIRDVFLEKGETNEFLGDEFTLSITFEKIANAGKNFLKKAVYYEIRFDVLVGFYGLKAGNDYELIKKHLDNYYKLAIAKNLSARPKWLAYQSTIFYYDESMITVANQLRAQLKQLTNRDFSVQKGAGFGVPTSEKNISLRVHLIE